MRLFASLVALLGGVALVLQFYLLLSARIAADGSVWRAIVDYLSFFTILTNILAAKTLSVPLLMPQSPAGRFFAKPSVQTGVAVYVTVVGLVYFTVLRHIWNPQGLQWWVDVALHYAIPLLYLLFWYLYVERRSLKYSHAFWWLSGPIVFLVYTIVRGNLIGYYPYPFLEVDAIGMTTVLYNSAAIAVIFLFAGFVFVWLNRSLPLRGK